LLRPELGKLLGMSKLNISARSNGNFGGKMGNISYYQG